MILSSASSQKIPCSVEILTRNSGKTLQRCLESVKDFAEIIVLDGNSADQTLEIARSYGCKIYKQYETDEPGIIIKDYAEVRNKGLKLASYDWFLYVDSDEYLSPEVVEEISFIVQNSNPEAYVWWQPRKYVVDGKVVDCATTYPNQQIRFFYRTWIKEFIKPIHERVEIKFGAPVGRLKNFEYVPVGSLDSLRARWARYLDLEERLFEGARRRKLLRAVLRQSALLGLYAFRYFRNFLFCRGMRMPLSYELARHKYTLRLILRLSKKLFSKK